MAEPSKESDQSMEDILQSIKRIIADEGDTAPSAGGSDVLELTELLAEDAAPPVAPEPTPAPKAAQDDIDALFAPAPAPAADEPIAVMPLLTPPAMPAAPPAMPQPTAPNGLMSDATLAASVAALNALAHKPETAPHHGSPMLRSGLTVEDLVVEALRPMLKEWLDGNLPELVRTLVEREIRRISGN